MIWFGADLYGPMTVFKKKYLSQKLLCTLFSLDEKSCQLRTEFSLDSIIHSYKSLWTPKVVSIFQENLPIASQNFNSDLEVQMFVCLYIPHGLHCLHGLHYQHHLHGLCTKFTKVAITGSSRLVYHRGENQSCDEYSFIRIIRIVLSEYYYSYSYLFNLSR